MRWTASSGEHARYLSAVFPIFTKNDGGVTKVLLHRRKNTDYMDGRWDIAASGHVDEGETATVAAARECMEELGIVVLQTDLHFAHLSHRFAGRTYYDIYFTVTAFDRTPRIAETDRCVGLDWFDLDALPDNVIGIRAHVLKLIKDGVRYSEIPDQMP